MTTSSKPKSSWREVLPIHPAADLFPLMSADELKALGEDIKKNGLQQAIIILSKSNGDELLLDGRNRLDAMERVGIKFNLKRHKHGWWNLDILEEGVPTIIIDLAYTIGESVDPYDYVVGANIHRRHLTAEKKRDLIAKVLKATPEKSNRQIAEVVKVDHKTVASVRAQKQATGEIPQLTKTIGKDGKARKTLETVRKPPTPPAPPQKATTNSAFVQSTPDQPPPAKLIEAAHDVIIAKCVEDVIARITEAVGRLDVIECVTLFERLHSTINGLLVRAKHAVNSMAEESPKVAESPANKTKTHQPDELPDIPEFLRRQSS